MKLEPGARVTERIVLQKPLGEGAMAAVWQAHHAGLDTDVAVKFLFAHAARRNPRLLTRFRAEASVAAKIRSPYVVQMLDYGVTEDNRPFLVMEKLDGEPLDVLLARRGPLPLSDVATVVKHVGRALAKAHPMGVVHRDIKPGNLFNVGENELFIKVLDFGIAKHAVELGGQSITVAGEVTGTPRYMSPEQLADSKDVDERADIWALAVVAYKLLTGRPPFAAESLPDLYLDVCSGTYTPASTLRPDLPPAVDDWLARCLTVDREERIQTAEAMVRAFPGVGELSATGSVAASGSSAPNPPPLQRTLTVEPVGVSGAPMLETMDLGIPAATVDEAPLTQRMGQGTAAGLVVDGAAIPSPEPRKRRGNAVLWVMGGLLIAGAGGLVFAWTRQGPPVNTEPAAPAESATELPSPVANAAAQEVTEQRSAPAMVTSAASTGGSPSSAASNPPQQKPAWPTGRQPPSTPPPIAPPPPPSKPNCVGDNAYIVDSDGHLIPKPGCM